MVLIQDNFLSDSDINFILSKWDESKSEFADYITGALKFVFVNLKKLNVDLSPVKNGLIDTKKFQKVRLQKYDDSYEQIKEYHNHSNYHNYVFFLNDDFQGGELQFSNGITIKPKKGSLVYFTENLPHRVFDCKGVRWVLTLCGNEPMELQIEKKTKSVI